MAAETFAAWRQARHDELAGPESWLGLMGLFWLEDAVTRVGSGDDCVVRLPGGPAYLGELICRDDRVVWQPVGEAPQVLQTDRGGTPTAVDFENWSFFIVDREGRLAARVRDRAWAASQSFAGLPAYPDDPAWVLDADWVPLVPPVTLEVPNVRGELKPCTVAFQAVFEVAGQRVTLWPMSANEREVFFVFRDRTSGRETYGAGRFLKAEPAVDGKIRIDFNRAYNPPCAFTPFATCPLPPPENWLPFPVPAGEMRYPG